MALVFKIKYQSTLRRLTIEEGKDGSLSLTFMDLVARICNMFHISPEERLVITYTDQDNDVVTMGDDQDLHDACIVQRINPLRIHVNVGDIETQKGVNRFKCLATEEPKPRESSFQDGLPPLANYTVEELIKLVNDWHTNGASPQKLEHDVTSYGSRAQANVSRREAETVDAASLKRCMVDNISRRVSRIFHKGVQCDGCGMTPIVGPRFKSTRKENYDLCCSCFTETGNETEFQRIDRPIRGRKHHHHEFAKSHFMASTLARAPSSYKQDQGVHHPFCADVMRDHSIGKLDARFVRDITIFDGTEMVAGTHFTKIWRLRNIGTCPWPHATQLVYTGGDVLGSDQSSFVELPAEGLQCEEEINVSVDLVAPQSPGRYVSHWRLRAPTGQKFGQRMWVLIQVVPKCMQSVLAHAATLPVKAGIGVPTKCEAQAWEEATLPSQWVIGIPAKDCQGMVKRDRDDLDAGDAMFFSSQLVVGTPANACQGMVQGNCDGLGASDIMLSSQLVVGMPAKDCQGMVKSDCDAWDAMLSSQSAPARDRQDIQDSTYQAGKPLLSLDMNDASCNEGGQFMGPLNVGTAKDQETQAFSRKATLRSSQSGNIV